MYLLPSEPVVLVSRKAQHKTASSIPPQDRVGGYGSCKGCFQV